MICREQCRHPSAHSLPSPMVLVSWLTVLTSHVLQVVACQVKILGLPVANPTKQEKKARERKGRKRRRRRVRNCDLGCWCSCSIRFVAFIVVWFMAMAVLYSEYCTVLVVGAHCSLYSTSFTGTVLAPDNEIQTGTYSYDDTSIIYTYTNIILCLIHLYYATCTVQ